MDAVIVTIGHEILTGHTVNTNANFIARELLSCGIRLRKIITIEDEYKEIFDTISGLLGKFELIISTGGLGPTRDDRTKSAVAKVFDTTQRLDRTLATEIEEKYKSLGYRRVPRGGMRQALVPQGARVFSNPVGSAPCLLLEKKNSMLFLLPGVPEEMKALMKQAVLPAVRERMDGRVVEVRTIKTSGLGETSLAEIIEPVIGRVRNPSISYLPGLEGVMIMLTGRGRNHDAVQSRLDRMQQAILPLIKQWVYSLEDEDIISAIARVLSGRGKTIAVAESCTGGLLASRLTDISGSSVYFERGIVTYSNKSKEDELKVPRTLLDKHGAVSRQVATAMAEGIRKASGADIALSTTGILGPTGATPKKPVGLVYIGYSDGQKTFAVKYQFRHDRAKNKARAVQMALMTLLKQITREKN